MKHLNFLKCAWIAVLVFFCYFSKAITITWNGSTNQSWEINTNWTPALVPTITDDVIINSDSVIIMKSYVAEAKSVIITGANVSLTIEDQAQLKISGSVGIGMNVQSSAKVLNYGSLSTNLTGDKGINLISNGSLENFSNIDVVNASTTGLRSLFSFINHSGAELNINNCAVGLIGSGSFVNNGSIHIDNISGTGLVGTDNFTNNHIIEIDDIDCTSCYGLQAEGQFSNSAGASINIKNLMATDVGAGLLFENASVNIGLIDVDSISARYGIQVSSGSNVQNQGTLNISQLFFAGSQGIRVDGNLSNSGIINITSTNNLAIHINDHFTNELSGQINIDSGMETLIATGLFIIDTLTNFGFIQIMDSTSIGISSPTAVSHTVNSGTVQISSSNTAIRIVSGSFDNGGDISINQCSKGIELLGAKFNNSIPANINISSINDGIDITSSSTLEILSGSEVLVSNAAGIPFQIDLGCELIGDGIIEFK